MLPGANIEAQFDWYEPHGDATCPICGEVVGTWQGKDGPNALFLWKEGRRHPVDQIADPDARISPDRYREFELPDAFTISGFCANDHHVLAECSCIDRTWSTTIVTT